MVRTQDGRYEVSIQPNTYYHGAGANEKTTNYLWEIRDVHDGLPVVASGESETRDGAKSDAWAALRALRDR